MRRPARRVAILLLAAGVLAACGRKGDPEPPKPPEEPSAQPPAESAPG